MGLLTPRGEEDDEQGDLTIAGLDLGGDGDDEITYDLDEWSEADRAVLRDRLETLGAPHTWEGTTLVVDSADEAWVERIMDQIDEELSAPPEDEVDDEQIAYDLTDWDDDSCVSLMETLATEAIPYALDGDELFVASEDEARVDEIVGALTTPGATLTLGGPASFEAMSELFVAADVLSKDPDDRHATALAHRRGAGGGRSDRPVRPRPGLVGRRGGPRRRAGRPRRVASTRRRAGDRPRHRPPRRAPTLHLTGSVTR